MCGIDGFLDLRRSARAEHLTDIVDRMTTTLVHRGPDASGSWVDAEAGIALGHRRLSHHRPHRCGRAADALGLGPLRDLVQRRDLQRSRPCAKSSRRQGSQLRGHCDTEVLLEAIDAWGLDRALERSNGMFAFALWDRRERRAPPGSRSPGREAPVLRVDRRHPALRLRAQVIARPPRLPRLGRP